MKVLDKIKKWWDNLFSLEVKMDDEEPKTCECGGPCVCGGECTCEKCAGVKEVVTLRDAFTDYIYRCRKENRYAESTIDSYEIMRDRHLQYIIDENLEDLTQESIQTAINNELFKGMSVSTVKKYRATLLKILEEYRPGFDPMPLTVKLFVEKTN